MVPPEPRPTRLRFLRLALLVLVPSAALAGWLAVQQRDRMSPPPYPFFAASLIYDEYDLSAMALRGLNAELGRQAGAPTPPRGVRYQDYSLSIEQPRPLKPRYFLEYPHAALILFRAGYWVQPGWRDAPIPPGLPDGSYHNIAAHEPETEEQFAAWTVFAAAARFYGAAMFVAWLVLIVVLERGYGPGTGLRGGTLLLLLPGAIFFTLNRYDVVPALLTALCFASLGRRRVAAAAIFLGLATLVKVYPVLFAPLVLRYLWPQRREATRFAAVYAATGLLALAPLLFGADWQAVWGPYKFQLTRPPEHGLTIYGCLLPVDFAEGLFGSVFRLGTLAAVMGLMLSTPIRDLPGLLRRCGVVLMVFVTLAVFYSPQWIIWFAPLLAPLAGRDRRVGLAAAGLDVVNFVTFPFWFWVLPFMAQEVMTAEQAGPILSQLGNLLRLARFLCCGCLTWYLLAPEWPWQDWLNSLRGRFPRWDAIFVRKS